MSRPLLCSGRPVKIADCHGCTSPARAFIEYLLYAQMKRNQAKTSWGEGKLTWNINGHESSFL